MQNYQTPRATKRCSSCRQLAQCFLICCNPVYLCPYCVLQTQIVNWNYECQTCSRTLGRTFDRLANEAQNQLNQQHFQTQSPFINNNYYHDNNINQHPSYNYYEPQPIQECYPPYQGFINGFGYTHHQNYDNSQYHQNENQNTQDIDYIQQQKPYSPQEPNYHQNQWSCQPNQKLISYTVISKNPNLKKHQIPLNIFSPNYNNKDFQLKLNYVNIQNHNQNRNIQVKEMNYQQPQKSQNMFGDFKVAQQTKDKLNTAVQNYQNYNETAKNKEIMNIKELKKKAGRLRRSISGEYERIEM